MRRRLSDAWTHPSAERAARLGTAGIPHRLSAGHALAGRRGDRIWRRRDGGAACAGSTFPDPQPAGRGGQAMSPAGTKTPAERASLWARLAEAGAGMAASFEMTPERAAAILDERARRLAAPPGAGQPDGLEIGRAHV